MKTAMLGSSLGLQTLLKRALLFSGEICEIYRSTYFKEHLRTTASEYIKNYLLFSLLNIDTELIFKSFGFNNRFLIRNENMFIVDKVFT